MEANMTIQYKETMTLIIIFALISLIIPFCMMTSSRNMVVQNSVDNLVIASQENQMALSKALKMTQPDHSPKIAKQNKSLPDYEKMLKEISRE